MTEQSASPPATGDTPPATGDPSTSPPATGTPPPTTQPETDWQAEAERWKSQARRNEDRAKANASAATELNELRQRSMTEQEKAVADAAGKAKAEALVEFGQRLVAAEVRAEAAGRNVNVDALLDGLDRSRFVDADGEVDRKAIAKFLDGIAPKGTQQPLDLGQGPRGNGGGAGASDMNALLRRAAGR